jgi:hypothetical protein
VADDGSLVPRLSTSARREHQPHPAAALEKLICCKSLGCVIRSRYFSIDTEPSLFTRATYAAETDASRSLSLKENEMCGW